jgi:hypothetical protein
MLHRFDFFILLGLLQGKHGETYSALCFFMIRTMGPVETITTGSVDNPVALRCAVVEPILSHIDRRVIINPACLDLTP